MTGAVQMGGLWPHSPRALAIGTDGARLGNPADYLSARGARFSTLFAVNRRRQGLSFLGVFWMAARGSPPRVLGPGWLRSICPTKGKIMNTDTCDCCGLELDDGSHFVAGKTWCRRCWSGQRPPVAMPPSALEQTQIADWLEPQALKVPAKAPTLNQRELAQTQGACRA